MADISDVANSLVSAMTGYLYPSGVSGPTSPSMLGMVVSVYAGWPVPDSLDVDLPAGKVHVSVFPLGNSRSLPLTLRPQIDLSQTTPTETATVSGLTVTIGGTATAGDVVSILANGIPYPYVVQYGDTPTTIAAALQALIVVGVPGTTVSGYVITFPTGTLYLTARIGGSGTVMQELERQEARFQIDIWAGRYDYRDQVANACKQILSLNSRYLLADQSTAVTRYESEQQIDSFSKQQLFRRTLTYAADYVTTITQTLPVITQIETEYELGIGSFVTLTEYT